MKRTGIGFSFRWILFCLLWFAAFFMVIPNAEAAVTGKIAGVVLDARTGEPLPGANVIIEGTDRGAACDADGYYYIIRLEPGTYNVQARMMGYQSVTKTGVRVESNHTTPLDFELESTIVRGEGVVVQAEREVVKMDLAGSSFAAEKSEIEAVPLISNVTQYLNLQAGIDGWSVRGGGVSQTKLMADGLLLVDQRSNEPILMPNLSEIKEVNLIKGGFEAEFANVRSGVINVITREGSPNKYEGSFEFRYTPGYQKHSGHSIFSPENYYNYPFLSEEDSVCFQGTRVWITGDTADPDYTVEDWIEDTVNYKQYPSFNGWISVTRRDTNVTAEDARARFIWMRRINTEGYDYLPSWDTLLPDSAYAPIYEITETDTTIVGYEAFAWEPEEGQVWPAKYGDKPDWTVDAGFGGPIPVIGQYLGDLAFYASYRDHNEAFAIPDSRDYYRERMASLKLTSRLGDIKLNLRGAYSIINSLSPWARGDEEGNADYMYGYKGQVYLRGGMDMLQPIAEWDEIYHGSDKLSIGNLFRANALTPFDIKSGMVGLTMQHALSENIFYDFRLTYIRRNNDAQFYYDVPSRIGGDTVVRWFGNRVIGGEYAVDDIPYGHAHIDHEEDQITDAGGSNYGYTAHLGTWDTSWSQTYNVSFDMTSQLDRYNQIKFGLSYQYDDLHEYWIANDGWVLPDSGEEDEFSGQQYLRTTYNENPILVGGYIQDKIEFEGMFANIGLRFDYSDPNTEWPRRETEEDLYSLFYSSYMKDSLFAMAPLVDADAAFEISPRLGISFPILERSKLFFNYGHFYSLPPNEYRYKIIWGDYRNPIIFIGNPSLSMERTISYEVGFESSIASTYLARVSGYYKDTDNEYAEISYTDYYGDVSYMTVNNAGYSDIRGFEFELRKAQGRFFTGWINYDYRVQSSGQLGREGFYQRPERRRNEGLSIPESDDALPRPVFNAQVTFKTPLDWGIFLGGYNLSCLYSWRSGFYDTYNPFGSEWDDILRNNVHWPDENNVDISISKNLTIGGAPVNLFCDIHNIFDWQTLSTQAFDYGNPTDRSDYYNSLRLEMYNENPWTDLAAADGPADGEEPDKIGDLRSDEKPYINNPNREFLYYLDMRYIQFGIRFSF